MPVERRSATLRFFTHRGRAIEGKDGNPLNEVRMLSSCMMNNHGVLSADKTIAYDPAKAVLKYAIGDEIGLDEEAFVAISEAFFAEIESNFV